MDQRGDRRDPAVTPPSNSAGRQRRTGGAHSAAERGSPSGGAEHAPPQPLASHTRWPVTLMVGLVGAWLVLRVSWGPSRLGERERWWAAVGVVLVSVALAWAVPAMRRLLPRPGDVPLVLAGVLVAIFLCVPETDQIVRVAAVVGVLTIGEGVTRRRAPWWLMGPVVAYVMWAGIFGATGRQSALVGALVAWWPMLLLPMLAIWRPALARTGEWTRGGISLIGFLAAVAVARTGALEPTIGPALAATAIALPVSLATAVGVAWVVLRPIRDR